jgi:hypothetical protein
VILSLQSGAAKPAPLRVKFPPSAAGDSASFDSGRGAQDSAMQEPGLDRHAWESEWQALEESIRANATDALSELDRLVGRMLEESGYDLTDPVAREGDEREVVAEYLAAHDIVEAAESGSEELSPGDVAAAINAYRAVSEHLVATRPVADSALDAADGT